MDLKDLFNYGGFAIGIIGILLSIYLYKRSLESKEPWCFYKTYRDIQKLSANGDGNIRVFYKSEEVDRVFTTYVWFWNKGKKPLSNSDIPPQSSIKLRLIDDKHPPRILDYRVVKTSREAINFIATEGQDFLAVGFDFLDHDDGAVLEIQHTGSSETELQAEGVILGVPEGVKVISRQIIPRFVRFLLGPFGLQTGDVRPKREIRVSLRRRILAWGMFIVMIVMVSWLVYDWCTGAQLTISVDKLQQILTTELPQLSQQNFQSIVAELRKRTVIEQIVVYAMIPYFGGLLVVMGALIWRGSTLPFPKRLYIEGAEEKTSPPDK